MQESMVKYFRLINFITNSAYNFKVLQVEETSFVRRNVQREIEFVKISAYGFDIKKHAQLAKGLQMKAIEASMQKASLGYAVIIVHYHNAPNNDFK